MRTLKLSFIATMLYGLMGCSYKGIECPGFIPGGYYNGYYNKHAVILYKRPSSKFGCWLSPSGWECVSR